ncbi:dienelactone hydrolase family protein [Lacinutrix jangbogonensis]|uniref:dienelactone hydrolase family protein n=1 Tax=Lacinutrix jangbogonensis TaxID=1469557 RepID=UPI00053E6BC8|nr:dienelactone hydrolase family protein [Lacinutrix jangbogonensis]
MKTLKHLLACLLLFTLIYSCSDSDDSNALPARTFADVQNDFNSLTFSTGINDVSLIGVDNAFWEFRVIMPNVDLTNNNRPLIITLHGFSGGDSNAHKNTACYAEPGFEALDAIIISPNNRGLQWFEPYNQRQIITLVDLASDYLPVDTNKVVVNGYSDGGNGAWWYSENYSNIFSAGIPMASAYGSYNPDNTARIIPTPTYVIHGENDTLFPLENTQTWVNDTSLSGSNTTLVIATGLTHVEPCNYISYLQDAATWLTDVIW